MFIFILNPTSGPEGAKNQQGKNKIEDPESVLKPLFADSLEKPDQASGIRPYHDPEKERIEHTLIRAMERAAGQLFDRQADPSHEMLMRYMEQYTCQEITPEREQAFNEFINAIREQKPDVKSHEREFLHSLVETWNNGKFEGLPEINVTRPRDDGNDDVEVLKKKGIEVLDGGVDPIAGARITLKIHGKEYTASYAPLGGVSLDSLQSEDGSPVNPDVIGLVKENNELITRVGMQVANKKGWIEG